MTSNERWERIKDVFESAISRTGGERRAYLEGACGADSAMLREVESLLASFDADYLEGAAVEQVADAFISRAIELKPGSVVGQYRIIDELGKGGQGAVYRAADTRLNRTVAIKTLPPELTIDENARKRFHREAQLASSLDHPNICGVHDLVQIDGTNLIVMPFVAGKNVRQLVNGRPLDLISALRIGIQVCDALAAAHAQRIIHRDIKAHNIIVTPTGTAKILDFGLAKLTLDPDSEQTELTALGSAYGTPTYAAPEQSRGEKVDHRADIFSTGVLMYELLTGTWAFHGQTAVDVRHAVLHTEPISISERRDGPIPERLERIVAKALAKKPAERYQDVSEIRNDLIEVLRALPNTEPVSTATFLDNFKSLTPSHFRGLRRLRPLFTAAAVGAVLVISVVAFGFYSRSSKLNAARANILRAEELARNGDYFSAYDLVSDAKKYVPDDPLAVSLTPNISDILTVKTDPADARVFLRRFQPNPNGNMPERLFIGATPVESLQIPRGDYVVYIEKAGFAQFSRSISGRPEVIGPASFNPEAIKLELKLKETSEVPERSVFVPGGKYTLRSWRKPTRDPAELTDFLIDKFEVSNREYREFVAGGGYLKNQYWRFPFVRDGKTTSWETAMAEFKDKTGLPGPRNWSSQNFPEGKADHPVTDISWYEAAAYAEFRGKSLPTIYQWEKAARDGLITYGGGEFMPWGFFQARDTFDQRANIAGRDTVPVESFEFGMSPFGVFNMAGNVAEWCANELNLGFTTAGGSWGDPPYNFGSIADFPGFYASGRLGFRCVKNLGEGEQGGGKIDVAKEVPVHRRSTEAEFEQSLVHYRYDKTSPEGQIVETTETDEWRREKIAFAGADDRAIAYLYLPKNYKPPYQTIQYVGAGDVWQRFSSVPEHIENYMTPYIRSGHAVFAVVLKGFIERDHPPGFKTPPAASIKFRDLMVARSTDLRRGLDYLETRNDIDNKRIVYWGYSSGAHHGLIFTAVDKRYRAMVMIAVGLRQEWDKWIPEANQANFAPHIKVPKLMLNGRYDEQFTWKTEAEPLFKLLSEPKQVELFEGGHSPTPEIAVPIISKWLDEKLGPVTR